MNESPQYFFDKLYGIPCWNAKKGHGSFLTFEFGEPYLKIGKVFEKPGALGFTHKHRPAYVHGAWRLWIYMCDWLIYYNDCQICHSESEDLAINRACGFLNGQSLTNVEIKPDGTTIFNFDLGGFLKTIPNSGGELEETWILYCPDKRVFTLQSDGRYQVTTDE